MKYAIIKSGGKQYKVSEGDVIEVDSLDKKKDDKIIFDNVLLLVSDTSVKIGKPTVVGEKVEGVVLEEFKGDKLYVLKYKAKVRYRRRIGFRARLTKVRIEKIGDKKEAAVKEIKKTAAKPKVKSK
jgi:large subunit ribosomal protein L21